MWKSELGKQCETRVGKCLMSHHAIKRIETVKSCEWSGTLIYLIMTSLLGKKHSSQAF